MQNVPEGFVHCLENDFARLHSTTVGGVLSLSIRIRFMLARGGKKKRKCLCDEGRVRAART